MKKTKLSLMLVTSLTLMVSSIVGFSFAAYQIIESFKNNPLQYNYGTAASYFAGGSGTQTDPYQLNTSEHLRNLQKLNALGIFDENTYFVLTSDINYEGEALLPIGNESCPFDSKFNGKGYTINNLVVNGNNTNDIGMFGYVGMNGKIMNFVLNCPTINVNKNDDGGSLTTTNPIAISYEQSSQSQIAEITPTNPETATTGPVTFATNQTSITIGDREYAIFYETSDPTVLKDNGNNTFTTIAQTTGNEYTKFPVQLTATVYGEFDGFLCSYVLERWQINVRQNGSVILEDNESTGEMKGYFRTLYQVENDGSTTPTFHSTYVGFFIGHLDGGASYLGLYGGTSFVNTECAQIIVNGRSVRSYSSLIGRSRNDNPLDDTAANRYYKDLDLTHFEEYNSWNTTLDMGGIDSNGNAVNNIKFNTLYQNNQSVKTINKNYLHLNDKDLEFLRFYPSFTINPQTKVISEEGVETTSSSIEFTDTMMAINTYQSAFLIFGVGSSISFSNCIYFMTSTLKQSGLLGIFTQADYSIEFRVKYVASGEGAKDSFVSVLYNNYSPNNDDGETHFIDLQVFENDYWKSVPNYNPVPLITSSSQENVIQEVTLDFSKENFGDSLNWTTLFGRDTYPTFALGIGSGTLENKYNYKDSSTTYYTYYNKPASSFSFNLLEFEITISAKDGNMSTLLNNVDYINNIPNRANDFSDADDRYTSWNINSETKINFNVNAIESNSVIKYAFYRQSDSIFGEPRVYGLFNNSTYPLNNTDNYDSATLQQQTW